MDDDEARMARLNKMIAESEATIDEAREAIARIDALLENSPYGSAEEVLRLVDSGACSPDLQQMIDDDLAKLNRELEEGETALLAESGRLQAPKVRHRTRRMTRI